MAKGWLFLKSSAPEVSAVALTSNTLYRAMKYEQYSLDKMLGVAYDMYAHELYQETHSLVAELIRERSKTVTFFSKKYWHINPRFFSNSK